MHTYHYTFLGHQEIKKVLALVDSTVFGGLKCLHHVYKVNIHIHVHVCTVRVTVEEEHWNVLIIECKSLSGDWEKISAYLGLSFKLIDTIKRDNPRDSSGCWNEALKQWIKQNYNTKLFGRPSWRSLLKAVAEVDKQQFQKLAVEHQGKKKTFGLFAIYIYT